MSTEEEADLMDQSTLGAKKIDSKSDEATPYTKEKDPTDFLIVTQVPQETYNFRWIIRQISLLEKNIPMYSVLIKTLATYFYLKFVKNEDGFSLLHERQWIPPGYDDFIDPELEEAQNANEFPIMLDYEVAVTDGSGEELIKWSVSNSESADYTIGEYTDSTSENFADDSLILNFNLRVTMKPTMEEIPLASKPSLEDNGWQKLSMDLKALYQNSLDTDITLVIGINKIRAHKSILSARSVIFKNIFHHDMEEAEQNSVVITDVEFLALQRLIEYLYTGVTLGGLSKDIDLQELYDLYYVADKYEVMDLREMTANTLIGRIQVDNTIEMLVWTDRHNDKNMKSKILNFIRMNFDAVSSMDTWESCVVHHPKLAVEVANFCAKKLKTGEK